MGNVLQTRSQIAEDLLELFSIWPGAENAVLRAPQFGGRNRFHRLRQLLSVLNRTNASAYIQQAWHNYAIRPRSVLYRSFVSLMAFCNSALISSSIALRSRIFCSKVGWVASRKRNKNSSEDRTWATSRSSSKPLVPANTIAFCFSTGSGTY